MAEQALVVTPLLMPSLMCQTGTTRAMPKFTFPPLVPCVTSGVEGSSKCPRAQAPRLVEIVSSRLRPRENLNGDLPRDPRAGSAGPGCPGMQASRVG